MRYVTEKDREYRGMLAMLDALTVGVSSEGELYIEGAYGSESVISSAEAAKAVGQLKALIEQGKNETMGSGRSRPRAVELTYPKTEHEQDKALALVAQRLVNEGHGDWLHFSSSLGDGEWSFLFRETHGVFKWVS